MISVYVRNADKETGEWLGDFSPEQLKPLVEQFKSFPIITLEGSECVFSGAQFTLSGKAFFEIVVEEKSE